MAHRVYNRRAARRKQEQRAQFIEDLFLGAAYTLVTLMVGAVMFASFSHTFGG